MLLIGRIFNRANVTASALRTRCADLVGFCAMFSIGGIDCRTALQ